MSSELTGDLRAILDFVVGEIAPERVVLFGSHATGTARSDSDIDLLIIVGDDVNALKAAQRLYVESLRQRIPGPSVDYVVVNNSRYQERRDLFGSVFAEADADGRELYAA